MITWWDKHTKPYTFAMPMTHLFSPLTTTSLLQQAFKASVYVIVPGCAFFLVAPFGLATITWLLRRRRQLSTESQSAICVGQVWHTRFLPIRHAFRYPLFLFYLDLEEVEQNGIFGQLLWPLSLIVSFRESDHLKNGEGLQKTSQHEGCDGKRNNALSDRLYRLIAERTERKFLPIAATHRLFLLTHLRYYGYNFNPVSFYILKSRKTDEICAVVGEVSNTPWNEMHCYVLHPDSIDKVLTEETVNLCQPTKERVQKLKYVFPKTFHVSPFMEMHYDYEWTFWNSISTEQHASNSDSRTKNHSGCSIQITNSLRQQTNENRPLQFSAKMRVQLYSMYPYRIAWYMATFPVYCGIIQVWIHWQAFILFLKGVTYQPHPMGSETWASRLIGNAMKPFFLVKQWWDQRKRLR